MLAHDPSHDPNCTADYGALPAIPDTVDFSPSEHSTDATPLHRSQSPEELSLTEAPAIPWVSHHQMDRERGHGLRLRGHR